MIDLSDTLSIVGMSCGLVEDVKVVELTLWTSMPMTES